MGVINYYGNTSVTHQVQGSLTIVADYALLKTILHEHVDLIEERLKVETACSESVAAANLALLEAIREELSAVVPRKSVLRLLVQGMDNVTSIAGLVARLKDLLSNAF